MKYFIFIILIYMPLMLTAGLSSKSILKLYDHDFHEKKAFRSLNFKCSNCHNFSLDKKDNTAQLSDSAKSSTFKKSTKALCHQCHNSEHPKFKSAPKTCYTCHQGRENLKKIKPYNHYNVEWKSSHALNAKVTGQSCTSCHSQSTCVKCHARRNTLESSNHTPIFRYTHSIEARMSPQRCSVCHTQTYCSNCHLGGGR
ncbi:MAG: hypothetical protein HOO06_12285 [Bdellovibrionaceae bacterium]|nr:hypothetical protein [Pseudobdellovibrionaceae bacterium]